MKTMKCIRCGVDLVADQIDLCEYCDVEAEGIPPTDEEIFTLDVLSALVEWRS